MAGSIVIQKGFSNTIPLVLGYDTTGDIISSQIRSGPSQDSPLIANFEVSAVDATKGEYTLYLDDTFSSQIAVDRGWMDIRRETGGEPIPVFEEPLEVIFKGTITKAGGAP